MADERNEYDEMKEVARCVQLYFREQKQQQEIAKTLGVSASKVSRLVKRAYTEGWVTVNFSLPHLPTLAAQVIEKYGLRDAIVISAGEPSELKRDLGAAGARYFERTVGRSARVGISCGLTLYYLVESLREREEQAFKIYPLSTEARLSSVDIFPNTLVGMMAAKYRPDVTAYALPAPDGKLSKPVKKASRYAFKSPEAQEIYHASHDVDIALIGVGSIDSTTPGFCAIASEFGLTSDHLRRMGAVAEYNYQLIDAEGHRIDAPKLQQVSSRIEGLSIDRLRELSAATGKIVMAIAGGSDKVQAVRAVLLGHLCNVLITDTSVAVDLLKDPPA